ncbi:MAG: Asp23/Gls24 family envelope stress response protein [Clostridia bacterium]|nr:Asp23/Gls24 family envelope stress response protein [Clostridia bacterium]
MNQDLPMHVDPDKDLFQEKGTITYATEVIATIVGVATTEVEGIASMAGPASISELFSGKPKNLSRGVRVEVGAEEVAVDVSVIVDYGMPIQIVGRDVQENIRKSIETMTGLHVLKVDVHVLGVSFEKENKELEQGQEVARLQSMNNGPRFGGVLQESAGDAGKPAPKQKNAKPVKVKEERAKREPKKELENLPEEQPASVPAEPADLPSEAVAETVAEAVTEAVREEIIQEVPEAVLEEGAAPGPDQPTEPEEPKAEGRQKGSKKTKKGPAAKSAAPNEPPQI